MVQALRARVAAITDELLAALPAADDASFDLITRARAFAAPVRVICDVLRPAGQRDFPRRPSSGPTRWR